MRKSPYRKSTLHQQILIVSNRISVQIFTVMIWKCLPYALQPILILRWISFTWVGPPVNNWPRYLYHLTDSMVWLPIVNSSLVKLLSISFVFCIFVFNTTSMHSWLRFWIIGCNLSPLLPSSTSSSANCKLQWYLLLILIPIPSPSSHLDTSKYAVNTRLILLPCLTSFKIVIFFVSYEEAR